ncbi:MAG: Fic family protein [Bdellovibrionaceae bacterium]|nr:Fic family protein [Pseudobdellovibrionaceae bacterium]
MTESKMNKNPLQEQLDEKKLNHAIAYVNSEALGIKKINSNELAHLNQLLNSQANSQPAEAWRFEATQVNLPSGHTQHFNVVSNPIQRARDILGHALQKAGNGEAIEGATDIYIQLVLEHLFIDANRRTAALAALWILRSQGMDIDAKRLLKTPIGNLRDPQDVTSLRTLFRTLVK